MNPKPAPPPAHYRISYMVTRYGKSVIRENELHAIPMSADIIRSEDAARWLACELCCSATQIQILRLETAG